MLPLFESGVPLLLERLRQLPDRDSITIAYPDEGAWKRFHYQFKSEGYPEVRGGKYRGGWEPACMRLRVVRSPHLIVVASVSGACQASILMHG